MDGKVVESSKEYMVYLTEGRETVNKYDNWICGGVIVTLRHIITAAACLEDVEKIYVVSGTPYYIRKEDLELDNCTKNSRKKIILTCVPKSYEYIASTAAKWSSADIGIGKVESDFDFRNIAEGCAYKLSPIYINYRSKWQDEGTHAFVLGWGHEKDYRLPHQRWNRNSNVLKAGSMRIVASDICEDAYTEIENMTTVIKKFMLCTVGTGKMDDRGDFVGGESEERLNENEDSCVLRNADGKCIKRSSRSKLVASRRRGICQNDHGGPLVTYVGSSQRLLGIASMFRIHDNLCTPPFLFTSTFCTQNFLRCFFTEESMKKAVFNRSDVHFRSDRRFYEDFCEKPSVRGFEMHKKIIKWPNSRPPRPPRQPPKRVSTVLQPRQRTWVTTRSPQRLRTRPVSRLNLRNKQTQKTFQSSNSHLKKHYINW